jgi:ribosome maturation factor RimP
MARRISKRKKRAAVNGTGGPSHLDGLKRQRAFIESVSRLAEPLCTAEGMELIHVEYQREPGGLTLRLYLDKPGGVTLDDCVEISRQVDDLLDAHLHDAPPYRLEVSSPGLDRPLGKLNDFKRFKGQRAKIRLFADVEGRKNFTGELEGVADGMVRVRVGEGVVCLDYNRIQRARLIDYNGES